MKRRTRAEMDAEQIKQAQSHAAFYWYWEGFQRGRGLPSRPAFPTIHLALAAKHFLAFAERNAE